MLASVTIVSIVKGTVHNAKELISKAYTLARPYGRRKLLMVLGISLLQGFFQVVGVTSVFPFLALAAGPSRLRDSQFGSRFLDVLPEMTDGEILIFAGIFAILMLLISNGINLLAEYMRARYIQGLGHFLRGGVLRRMVSRPYRRFLNENSAVLVKKVTGDVSLYISGVLLPLLDSFTRVIMTVLLIITLFLVHAAIAFYLTLGFGLFYLIVFRVFGDWRKKAALRLKLAKRGIQTETQQMLGGIKTVKVHCCEEKFIGRFSKHSAILARTQAWSGVIRVGPRYLVEPLTFAGVVVVVLIHSASNKDLSSILPNLGVMALAGYRLLPTMQLLYGQFSSMVTQRYALDEVYDEFMEYELLPANEAESANGRLSSPQAMHWSDAIVLEDLTFRYENTNQLVLDRLNLTIPKNSFIGFVGPTGCGKSTLVDLILGLHMPSEGKILIDGQPLNQENRRAWRAGVGYVPQDIFLIDDTVSANIALGLKEKDVDMAALRRAATAAQILEFIETELPDSWQTVVGERGMRLSGGQRQRIGLARALYHEPELLILDEATSALDNQTEQEVMKAINSQHGKVTIIIIAHRLSTVEFCDEVIRMEKPASQPKS